MVAAIAALVATACGAEAGEDVDDPAAADDAAAADGPDDLGDENGGNGLEELIAAAQEEGSLNLYTGTIDAHNDAMIQSFEEEYGITVQVNVTRQAGGPLIQQFLAEAEAGNVSADVFMVNIPPFFSDNAELFEPIDAQLLPDLDDYPADAVGEYSFTHSSSPLSMQFNTSMISPDEAPRTWQEVLDFAYETPLLLTDIRQSGAFAGWAEVLAEEHGIDFIESIGAMDYELVASAAPAAQQVAAGAYAASFPAFPSQSAPLAAEGAPIDFIVPEGPALVAEMQVAVVADANSPNAARLFANVLLRRDTIERVCAATAIASPLDPDGELGCVAVPETTPVEYEVGDDRLAELAGAMNIRE